MFLDPVNSDLELRAGAMRNSELAYCEDSFAYEIGFGFFRVYKNSRPNGDANS